jgi:PD-(D/E)XK nuclease superfamily
VKVPQPPSVKELTQLTPSLYEDALHCKARAIWSAFGDRKTIPQHPNTILGICFHKILQLANQGRFPQDEIACRDAARQAFDKEAQSQYDNSHPLIKSKFSSPSRLPYYNLARERATLHSVKVMAKVNSLSAKSIPHLSGLAESPLVSRDGLLKGRVDYINLTKGEIIDYKSGIKAEGFNTDLSDAEARQLRFYAYLSLENDIHISKGVIVRGNNQLATLTISPDDAENEGELARALLRDLKDAAASDNTFRTIAQPSAENCKNCSCIPLCEAFWENATPEWKEQCGAHLEAEVIQCTTSGVLSSFVTIEATVRRGTIESGLISIEQIPFEWLMIYESMIPQTGDIIRVIEGALSEETSVIRVKKLSTSIWISQAK